MEAARRLRGDPAGSCRAERVGATLYGAMEAYRLEATIQPDGTLTIDGLPLGPGTSLEVVVLVKQRLQSSTYPLQGTPYRFDDPFSPAVPLADAR